MELKRVRGSDWLMAAAAAALLGALWLDWFKAGDGAVAVSAWQVFSVTDLLLAVTALTGLLTLFLAAANDSPARPVASAVVTLALSAIALLAVVYRVVLNEPGPNADVDLATGAYVGALLTLGLFAASLAAVRDESSPHQAPIVPTQLPAPPAEA